MMVNHYPQFLIIMMMTDLKTEIEGDDEEEEKPTTSTTKKATLNLDKGINED